MSLYPLRLQVLKIQWRPKIKGMAIKAIINYTAFPAIVLGVWALVTRWQWFSPAILPPPSAVLTTFTELLTNGQLLNDLSVSLLRVLQGYGCAAVLGIGFGILMGAFAGVNRFFTLVFDAVRQIPPLAWIPLVILWFGIGEASKVIIIGKAAFFPILVNTIGGIHSTSRKYLEVGEISGTSRLDLVRNIYLPSSLPAIFIGLRLGLSMAWMTMVAAELVAASSGLGYLINDGRELSQPDLVIVGMITIGGTGIVMDLLLKVVAKKLLYWRDSETEE